MRCQCELPTAPVQVPHPRPSRPNCGVPLAWEVVIRHAVERWVCSRCSLAGPAHPLALQQPARSPDTSGVDRLRNGHGGCAVPDAPLPATPTQAPPTPRNGAPPPGAPLPETDAARETARGLPPHTASGSATSARAAANKVHQGSGAASPPRIRGLRSPAGGLGCAGSLRGLVDGGVRRRA